MISSGRRARDEVEGRQRTAILIRERGDHVPHALAGDPEPAQILGADQVRDQRLLEEWLAKDHAVGVGEPGIAPWPRVRTYASSSINDGSMIGMAARSRIVIARRIWSSIVDDAAGANHSREGRINARPHVAFERSRTSRSRSPTGRRSGRGGLGLPARTGP